MSAPGVVYISAKIADNNTVHCTNAEIKYIRADKYEELVAALKMIVSNDKTRYEYGGRYAKNNNDEMPEKGKRWATPMEIAQQALKAEGEL
jgi:hypothetical protein